MVTGTTRTEGPPRPILGPRVAQYVVQRLEERGHKVTLMDPKQLPLLEKPEFAYSPSQKPPLLQKLRIQLTDVDAYVAITPEYNHAPSPGLVNFFNHFGSSVFSFKPSAIVSYSAGQWGGTRAALALRPILSELGCLPVSAMVHVPHAADVWDEQGHWQAGQDEDAWQTYTDRCWEQLEWWATAAKEYKQRADPWANSPPFQSSPSQRNAPSQKPSA